MTVTVSEKRRPAHRKVGRRLMEVAAKVSDEIMSADPLVKKQWLDNLCTSHVSNRDGIILLEGDYDWTVAFLLWKLGYGHRIPREPE